MGVSGVGFLLRVAGAFRPADALLLVVVLLVVFPVVAFPVVVFRLVVVRRRRPGMDLPLVSRTVGGGTDGTSDGIAG